MSAAARLAEAKARLASLDAERVADYRRDPATWAGNRSADDATHERYMGAVYEVLDLQHGAQGGG